MDLRDIIKQELKRQNQPQAWLAKQIPDMTMNSVYRYLRGERDTTGENLGHMLDVLNVLAILADLYRPPVKKKSAKRKIVNRPLDRYYSDKSG